MTYQVIALTFIGLMAVVTVVVVADEVRGRRRMRRARDEYLQWLGTKLAYEGRYILAAEREGWK